jgi:hypothetical protein
MFSETPSAVACHDDLSAAVFLFRTAVRAAVAGPPGPAAIPSPTRVLDAPARAGGIGEE